MPNLNNCISCDPLHCETRNQNIHQGLCLKYSKCSRKEMEMSLDKENRKTIIESFRRNILQNDGFEKSGKENFGKKV